MGTFVAILGAAVLGLLIVSSSGPLAAFVLGGLLLVAGPLADAPTATAQESTPPPRSTSRSR
ncbi:hypothetical protein [uncultured Serinicoccus sp.]|uniref:hypothetical protein n=1 Tax=uncultured Serinicoccus sp. TaxID=735514 RepID=UPI0026157090|nr:hypothetical protein [uncultured Serinicoccus sp.]